MNAMAAQQHLPQRRARSRRLALRSALWLKALALVLLPAIAGAQGFPQCPPTSPDPLEQTVDINKPPEPLRIQLDVIATATPPPAQVHFSVITAVGTFAGGQTSIVVPAFPVLVDPVMNRWRYSASVNVAPFGAPAVIQVRGATPSLCKTAVIIYTINVVEPTNPPPSGPRITVLDGNGARVEPGASVDIRVRLDDPPVNQSAANFPLRFAISAGDARFDANGGSTLTVSTGNDGTVGVRVRAGTQAGAVTVGVEPAPSAPFAAAPGTVQFAIEPRLPRTFLVISGDRQSGPVGTAGGDLVAALVEFNGFPAGNVGVEWRTVDGPEVQLTQPTGITAANGRVQTGIRFATQPGTSIVEARAGSGESARFTVTTTPAPGAATIAVVSGSEQSGAVSSDADEPVVFVLTEANQPIAGETVTFRVAQGSATLLATSATTDAQGRASVRFRYGASPGRIRIDASARGSSASAFATAFTPDLRIASGDNQSASAGTRLPQDFVLVISQPSPGGSSKGFAGVPVTWTVTAGGGTLATATGTTDAQGRASNRLTLGPAPGENRVRATLPGIGSVEFVANATTATARITLISGDGQSGAVNSDGDQPIVFALTEDSRPLAGESVTFRVAQGSATLLATSATTDAQGRASVRFRYGSTPGPVRIEATARGVVASATATAFAPDLRIASGNGQSGRVNTRLAQDLVVQIAQPTLASAAKGLAGVPVSWTVVGGGGSLGVASGTTDAQGRASNQLTLGPTPGENRVRATLAGIGSIDFVATAVDPVPAGSVFEIVSGNGQSLPTAAPSAPLVVRLRTSGGAPVVGTTVAFTVSPAGAATLSNTTATTAANGQAQTIATVGLPGEVRVIASLPDAGSGGPTLVFTLNGGVVNTLALDPNERSIAAAIDAACPALFRQSQQGTLPAAAADLLARCSEMVANAGSRPDVVKGALRQMLSEESDAQNTASISAARAQYENLAARASALRSGSTGISVDGLTIATSSGALPLSFLPSALLMMQDDSGSDAEVGADFSRWGFFATGTIGWGELDDRGSSPGFDFDTYGLTAGVDYRFSDRFVAGAAIGYSDTDTEISADSGTLATRGLSISGYGTWYRGEWFYIDGTATLGRNSYELSRRVLYTVGNTRVDQVALAEPDGDQRSFTLSIGRDVNRGALNFSPYLRAAWTRIDFDPYIERMSAPNAPGAGLALAVEGRTLRSLEGVFGAKVSYTMSRDWGILIPHATVEILREFEDAPSDVVSRFVNDPTRTPIVVQGLAPDRDYFNLGLGLSGVFANGRSAFVYLENRAGQRDYTQTTIAAGLRIEF